MHTAATHHAAAITRACRRIEASETPPPLADLTREASLSPHHFQRVFKAHTGVTSQRYAQSQRASAVRQPAQLTCPAFSSHSFL